MTDYLLEELHKPYAALLHAVLDELTPAGARLALDIGCGPGLKANWLAKHLAPGALAIGVDKNHAALSAARNTMLTKVAADAHNLPLQAACADLCWCVAALGLFVRPELALAEARRALQPGGALVIAGATTVWARPRPYPAALLAALAPLAVPLAPADDLGDELRMNLVAAGFATVDTRAYLLEPPDLSPQEARISLLAWAELAPLAAPLLDQSDLTACAAAEAAAEPEPRAVLLAALAR